MRDIEIIEDDLAKIGGMTADAMALVQEMKALAERMEEKVLRAQRAVEALYLSLEG